MRWLLLLFTLLALVAANEEEEGAKGKKGGGKKGKAKKENKKEEFQGTLGGKVRILDESNFATTVYDPQKWSLVFFLSEDCQGMPGPCAQVARLAEELEKKYKRSQRQQIYKVDCAASKSLCDTMLEDQNHLPELKSFDDVTGPKGEFVSDWQALSSRNPGVNEELFPQWSRDVTKFVSLFKKPPCKLDKKNCDADQLKYVKQIEKLDGAKLQEEKQKLDDEFHSTYKQFRAISTKVAEDVELNYALMRDVRKENGQIRKAMEKVDPYIKIRLLDVKLPKEVFLYKTWKQQVEENKENAKRGSERREAAGMR